MIDATTAATVVTEVNNRLLRSKEYENYYGGNAKSENAKMVRSVFK